MSRSKVKMLKRLLIESLSVIDRMKNDGGILEENFKLALENRELKEENEKLSREVIFYAKESQRIKENSKIAIDKLFEKAADFQRENRELKLEITKVISRHENKFFKGTVVKDLRNVIKNC